jgi:hypothetical protein
MEELPRGWKIPKFTKFGGETNESTVEHIARYLTDAGDIATLPLLGIQRCLQGPSLLGVN